jgi:hypothetical protein
MRMVKNVNERIEESAQTELKKNEKKEGTAT